jgi:hypothetical protein
MVTVAIRALELDYLVKILDWGRSRSRYIFTHSDSTALLDTAYTDTSKQWYKS